MLDTQYIKLNMVPSGVVPVIYASQYDIGRPLGLVVYDGAAPVDLSIYTATIEASRSDGAAITASVTTETNIAVFETTATMTNKADKYPAQLVLVDADQNRVASLPFVIAVVPAAMDENSEAIQEDASLYQQYTGTVQALIAQMKTELEADIDAEEQARIAAINAEASTRSTQDQTLQNNINTEAATRAAADTTLQRNIDTEAATRSSQTSSLQSQINQIVAPSGEAPSAAEVQNARIGANGVTYTTLGDAIREQFTDLNDELIKYNSRNLIPARRTAETTNGITFTPTNYDEYIVNGTASANALYKMYDNATQLPRGFIPGQSLTVKYLHDGQSGLVWMQMFKYTSSGLVSSSFYANSVGGNETVVTIPADAVGLLIRLRVTSGTTVNNLKVYPVINNAPSNQDLDTMLNNLKTDLGDTDLIFKELSVTQSMAENTYGSLLANVPANTAIWTNGSWWEDAPSALGTYFYVYSFGISETMTGRGTQVAINPSTLSVASRRISSGSWTAWVDNVKNTGENISSYPVLYCYGDSLTWGAVWDSDPDTASYQAQSLYRMPTRIANAIGSTEFYNKGVSGARYVKQGSSDTSTIIGDVVKATDLSGADIVVIGGGRNDSATSLGDGETATAGDGTICGAIVDILEYLTTTYPELQIVLFGVTPQPTSTSHDPEHIFTRVFAGGWSLNTFYTEAAKACARYGVPFINWYDCTLMLRWGQLSGGYSSGTQNWSHPLNEHIYMQMGNYLGGKVSSYYKG